MDSGPAGGKPLGKTRAPWEQLDQARSWDELVLPDRELALLKTVADKLRLRTSAVVRGGSGPLNRLKPGLTVLLIGERGTGKTMAAWILGTELGRPVVQMDLAALFAEESGEPQKQIDHVFAEAESQRAILVFDWVAPFFGKSKRAGSRSSTDELFDVLERSDAYPGAVIFTLRRGRSIDTALADRFDHVVEFPVPRSTARWAIWRRLLPADARVNGADLAYLATSFELTGGAIRGCCLAAAADAADDGAPVRMVHLARAIERHYQGRRLDESTRVALKQLSETARLDEARPPTGRVPAPAPNRKPSPAPNRKPAPAPNREPAPAPNGRAAAATNGHAAAEAWTEFAQTRRSSEPFQRRPPMIVPRRRTGRLRWQLAISANGLRHLSGDGLRLPWPGWTALAGRRSVILALLATVAAAVLGVLAVRAVDGGGSSPAPLAMHVSAGTLRASIPSGWGRHVAPDLPLALSDELAVSPAGSARAALVIGRTQTAGPTLLPQSLLVALASLPSPQIVTLGGARFYRYLNLSPSGTHTPETIYALPTTAGTVLGVCLTPTTTSSLRVDCERILGTLRLSSGTVLPPGPSPTYAAALNTVITRLNAIQTKAAASLHAAVDAPTLVKDAGILAAAHAQAASALLALNAGQASTANTALAAALRMTSAAYVALRRAAAAGDAQAYRNAKTTLAGATRMVNAAFAQLGSLGYRVG